MTFRILIILIFLSALSAPAQYQEPAFPFAPAAGSPGSTAVRMDDPAIQSWADGVFALTYGEDVDAQWQVPQAALGPADSGGFDVLVLGRGGAVTLEFTPAIRNGEGFDFAVFENGISDYFLELAFVEVSSDGLHFVRFPAYSYTNGLVPAFGTLDPTFIDGLASKYRVGFGTPFDLQVLADAYAAVGSGYSGFSQAYGEQLTDNFPFLDLEAIRFVRILDIPGDGSALDCQDAPIYDPYKTVGSAGFDLDAVAVLNQSGPEIVDFSDWSSGFGLPANPQADTDHDGWGQWLEYRMGSNPVDASSIPLTMAPLADQGLLELSFTLNLQARGNLDLQVRDSSGNWNRWNGNWELLDNGTDGPPVTDRYRVQIPVSADPVLVRFTGQPD